MPPQRIISVVPSQTELLFDLGLNHEVVGITKFCIHPATKVTQKAVVGGTKTVNLSTIYALKPDLILANKEENNREQIEQLQRDYLVHVTDVSTLPEALAMIREVGTLVGRSHEASALAQRIADDLGVLPAVHPQRVAYLIWRNPYMVAANHTFIHAMLELAGFQNAFAELTRYPEVTADALLAAQPDLIFLSSEPYPFSTKHEAEFQSICPAVPVHLVDGEMFSWYGSRLLRASDYFKNLRTEVTQSPV